MNKIDFSNKDIEKISEQRREGRKKIERGIVESSSDSLQLNDIMLAVIVIIAAAISFTDFSLSLGSLKDFTALSLFLYVITTFVYRNRYARGKERGKNDEEYKKALYEYREKKKIIYDKSLAGLVPDFCIYYKKKELKEYKISILTDVEFSYEEYIENFQKQSDISILRTPYSMRIKKALLKCNHAKPVKLMPGLILNENGEMSREKLIGQSGRERELRDKKNQLFSRALIVLFGSVIAINVIFDFSLITVFQWVVRMLPVVSAIIVGDDAGYCNITVTETRFKQDQVAIMNLFEEYVEKTKSIEK